MLGSKGSAYPIKHIILSNADVTAAEDLLRASQTTLVGGCSIAGQAVSNSMAGIELDEGVSSGLRTLPCYTIAATPGRTYNVTQRKNHTTAIRYNHVPGTMPCHADAGAVCGMYV